MEGQRRLAAFRQALQEAGWEVGRNVRIDIRWAGDVEIDFKYAMELLALAPDVFLAGVPPLFERCKRLLKQCQSIQVAPIRSVPGWSRVWRGRVAMRLAFPHLITASVASGWNFSNNAPSVTRVAILRDPDVPAGIGEFAAIQTAAQYVAVELRPIDTRNSAEIEQAMSSFTRQPGGGLIVTQNTSVLSHRKLIIGLAASHRLPTVYASRFFVAEGGLLSYGTNLSDNYRRAAGYVDRILKGEKPADLRYRRRPSTSLSSTSRPPRPSASTVPATMLARADEVIE